MNWPLALGVAVIIAAPSLAAIRAILTAPIGEEVDGLGFVADAEPNSRLSREQYPREGDSRGLRGLSVRGQVDNLTHEDASA